MTSWTGTQREEIARLKSEAKRFRGYAAAKRLELKRLKSEKDWLGAIKAQASLSEYVFSAQKFDEKAKEVRAIG